MVRIAVLGATGYTALELLKILARHPQAEVTTLTSRQEGRPHLASVHPQLNGLFDLHLEDLPLEKVAERADCVFSCLPHGASAASVHQLARLGCRVVDFSADYRLGDLATYQQWYDEHHPDPDGLVEAPYGLPELFADSIAPANIVANPGCYPTSAILALAPLLKAGLISGEDLIVDSKSGVSGAGRTPKLTTHFPECNESLAAYNVGQHRHTPEIEHVLSVVAGRKIELIFTPHLIPMDRGILTTAYARPSTAVTSAQLIETLRDFYRDQPFVRVVDGLPATKHVSGTNFCDVTARVVRDRVVTISCIDNLIKGASGVAVQNMNLMYGYPVTTAL
ncbi:MAG: N-acetyl-gamma-glutamyl-phosphate reductase [Pirellulales bacterium]